MGDGRARRVALALAFALALPAPILAPLAVDSAVAWRSGFALTSAADAGLALAAAVSTLAGLGLLVSREGRTFARARRAKAIAFAVSVLVGLGLAEVGARVVSGRTTARSFHRREPRRTFEFHPDAELMPGVPGIVTHYTTNARGVRGPELPATREEAKRILCLGGSTTECVYLDDDATWPALLGRAVSASGTKVWVGNAGISGFTSAQDLRFAREGDLMDEIDALVVMTGLNDLVSFLVERGSPPLWRRTELAVQAHLAWSRTFHPADALHFDQGGFLIDETGRGIVRLRANRHQQGAPIVAMPDLAAPLADFAGRVRGIAEAARAHHVRPIFVTQTAVWKPGLSPRASALCWLGWAKWLGGYVSIEGLAQGIAAYDERVLATCRELGVECVDLASLNGNEACFYDDCHFTQEGAREVARILAAWLAAHPL